MSVADEVLDLIMEHDGVLERQNKHNVWKFPDGRIFITARSPSDSRADLNNLSQLRRFLGVKREIVKNPDRKEKVGVGKPLFQPTTTVPVGPTIREQLQAAMTAMEQPQVFERALASPREVAEPDPVVEPLFMEAFKTSTCQHRTESGFTGATYWCSECKSSFCAGCFHLHNEDFHPEFVYYKGKK